MPLVATVPCQSHNIQECTHHTGSWTSLWYVWLIMLTVFLLLMCGIGASCVKFCCRKKRPPVQTFPPQAHDLTAIPIDPDSTAHSTVTSYSSIQYPQSIPLPLSFREMDRSLMSPPAYSLYAIELPPSYDEAIKMAKPYIETPVAGQEQDKNASQSVTPEEQNHLPSVALEEQNQLSSVALEEQNQLSSVALEEQNQLSSVALEEQNQLPSVAPEERNQLPSVAPEERNHLPSVTPEERNQPPLVAPEEQNQPQTLTEMSGSSPETVHPGSQLPEVSTQRQPELYPVVELEESEVTENC